MASLAPRRAAVSSPGPAQRLQTALRASLRPRPGSLGSEERDAVSVRPEEGTAGSGPGSTAWLSRNFPLAKLGIMASVLE